MGDYRNINSIVNKVKGSKKNSLLQDSFWSLLGNTVLKGLSLFAGVYVARVLGKDVYGEFGMLKTTMLFMASFVTFGFGYTATKFVAENSKVKEIQKAYFKSISQMILLVGSVFSVLFFLLSSNIAVIIFNNKEMSLFLKIVSVLFTTNAYLSFQTAVIAGFSEFKKLSIINIISGVFSFIVTVLFAYYYGLQGALYALLLTQLFNICLNCKFINIYFLGVLVKSRKRKLFYKKAISASFPVALQEILFSITAWINSLLIIRFSSSGELGIYSVAIQWNGIILFIPSILRNVILTHLSKENKNNFSHNKILNNMLLINFGVTLIASLFIGLLSGVIVSFYGESYEGMEDLISIAVFTTVFMSMFSVYAQAYMSKDMNWEMFFIRFFRDIFIVVLFIIAIKVLDLRGAKGMVLSSLIGTILFLGLTHVFYKFKLRKDL